MSTMCRQLAANTDIPVSADRYLPTVETFAGQLTSRDAALLTWIGLGLLLLVRSTLRGGEVCPGACRGLRAGRWLGGACSCMARADGVRRFTDQLVAPRHVEGHHRYRHGRVSNDRFLRPSP